MNILFSPRFMVLGRFTVGQSLMHVIRQLLSSPEIPVSRLVPTSSSPCLFVSMFHLFQKLLCFQGKTASWHSWLVVGWSHEQLPWPTFILRFTSHFFPFFWQEESSHVLTFIFVLPSCTAKMCATNVRSSLGGVHHMTIYYNIRIYDCRQCRIKPCRGS